MRRDVEAHLDGELREAERTIAVRSHLLACAACRNDVDALHRLKESLRRLGHGGRPVTS